MASSTEPPDRPAWQPEREVPPELAGRLIEAQFPELAPVRVQAMTAGWDNTVFLINRCWIFRFPGNPCRSDSAYRSNP